MTYRVNAYNSARESENRIHDDAVARRLGFGGGLVPGVDVFAYLAHPPVARWREEWLRRGEMTARFLAPVYDGAEVDVTDAADGAALALAAESGGARCAEGRAALGEGGVPAVGDAPSPPDPGARPPASIDSLAPGRVLGMRPLHADAAFADTYLRNLRETDPLYGRAGVLHPGLLLRTCNWALTQNVVLGPWIHVGSTIRFCAMARVGAVLGVAATVAANEMRKGHAFVELEAAVLADGAPVAGVRHVAIWRPRQLAGV